MASVVELHSSISMTMLIAASALPLLPLLIFFISSSSKHITILSEVVIFRPFPFCRSYLHRIRNYISCPFRFGSKNSRPENGGELLTIRYSACTGDPSDEPQECAVCLRVVEQGNEIAELRCNHVFHKACSDRWIIGFRRRTCPICRCSVGSRTLSLSDEPGQEEVLLLNLWSLWSLRTHGREYLWLR